MEYYLALKSKKTMTHAVRGANPEALALRAMSQESKIKPELGSFK